MVCAGGAVLDRKFHLRSAPALGTSNPALAGSSFGGVARNVAEHLARLGAGRFRVALVSAVGDDPGGLDLLSSVAGCGILVDAVSRIPGEATAQYVAVLDPEGDLVIGVAAMDVLTRITAGQVMAAARGADWLFVDCNLAAPVLADVLADVLAGSAGVAVAVDAVSTPKVVRLPADLRAIALLSLNADEARAWLTHHHQDDPIQDDAALARRICAAGADVVLLTRGAAGVLVARRASGGEIVVDAVPAPPVAVLDVTGAGDALVAGTLAGLLAGGSPRAAAGVGVALAAHTVSSRDSVPRDVAPAVLNLLGLLETLVEPQS